MTTDYTGLFDPKALKRKARKEKIKKVAKVAGVVATSAATAAAVASYWVRHTEFEFKVIAEETGEIMGTIKSQQ